MSASELPDDVWRKPDDRPADPHDHVADQRYHGPPASTPPTPGWRPPLLHEVTPPRPLPELDHDAINDAERRARTLTYWIGYGAVAVLLITALTRVLF